MKTLTLLSATLAAFACALPSAASAQTWPSKPIRVITANSAGGTSDIFVRALGDELQKRLGQPIIVENRSGGGMNIAGRACSEAPNDGYNICILPNEVLTLNEFTFKSIPYNPEKDFDPITNAFINTQVLVVSSALGVSSLDELAALSKAKPGTLSYSVLAIPMQITFENWKKKTGADIVMVPSRGGNDMVTGLLTGTVPVSIVGLPNFIPHIRSGAVKAIAVDSETRSPLFPDVPTLRELGLSQSGAGVFRLRRAGRNAEGRDPEAARRDRRDRQRAVVPAEAAGRHRHRAGVRHAGAFRGLSEGAARQRPEADSGVRIPAAVDAAFSLVTRPRVSWRGQERLKRPLDRAGAGAGDGLAALSPGLRALEVGAAPHERAAVFRVVLAGAAFPGALKIDVLTVDRSAALLQRWFRGRVAQPHDVIVARRAAGDR